MISLITKRKVAVRFKDYPPNNNIDETLFDHNSYQLLSGNGLSISPLKLIHCAAVHYQGRYKKSPSKRFLNAFIELHQAFSNQKQRKDFTLNNTESNELQVTSTEVIAVGLCVALSRVLFNIKLNRITPIEGTGKRCDLKFVKNGIEYIFESKGRKQSNNISSAISDIFDKKVRYPQPKYGFVSYLPRNGEGACVTVVDPDVEVVIPDRPHIVLKLLIYYSRQSLLAGFWELSRSLNDRIEALKRGDTLELFENQPLDSVSIFDFGIEYKVTYGEMEFQTFFGKDHYGFYKELDQHIAFISMDKKLITILKTQNYSKLLEYHLHETPDHVFDERSKNCFSINNDGSFLCIVNKEELSG